VVHLIAILSAAVQAADDPGADAEGDEVVVTAPETQDRADPMATPASVTVIAVDERLPASSDVSTVVSRASGVTVQRLGGLGDWSGVSIRGSTMRQVQVCLDGIPLNPDGTSAVNLSELPLWAFETIEVYRGNAPPELGAAPIGGVVDLRTGDRDEAGSGGSVSWGSHDTFRLSAMTHVPTTLGERPADALVVAEAFGTAGDYPYFSDNGTEYALLDDSIEERANNDKRQATAHLRFRLGDRALRLTLLEAFVSRDEGLAGHASSPTTAVSLRSVQSVTALAVERGTATWRGELRGWARLRKETYDDRLGELGTGQQHTDDRFSSLGAQAHLRRRVSDNVLPAVTFAVRHDGYASTDLLAGAGSAGPEHGRLSLTPAVSADLRFAEERLTLSPVLQGVALLSNEGDPILAPTPRAGLLVRPIEVLAVKSNVAWTTRPPDFTELYGDRGAIIGNPELSPESGLQWDVGLRAVTPSTAKAQASVEVTLFENRSDELIVVVQNSQGTGVPVNLSKAWVQGVESSVHLGLGPLDSQTNATRTRSADLGSRPQYANNQLPRVPLWELSQATSLAWGDRVRLGHTLSHTAANYWDRTNFYRAAPRTLHGAFARVRPLERGPHIELGVRNLFDRTVEVVPRNPLDPSDGARIVQPITDFTGYPLPGRTWMATLRWSPEPPSSPAPEAT